MLGVPLMTVRVRDSAGIDADGEVLSGYLADYRVVSTLVEGLEDLEPVDPGSCGPGARFNAVVRFGPRKVRSIVELVEVDPGREVLWSASGDGGRLLRFTLSGGAGGVTLVSLEISYEPPGGIAGVLLAPVVEQTVRTGARVSLERLSHLAAERSGGEQFD
ncbi:MAG: SRPBCC family protein [Acidimicrobiales bacterium]